MKKLIDISDHNGLVDWDKVRGSGIDGVMIKIGWSGFEGEIHYDKRVEYNIRQAYKAGLNVGLYVYAYNKHPNSAIKTANECVEFAKKFPRMITFPIAIDIEETKYNCLTYQGKNKLAYTIKAFCDRVKELEYYPMWYSYSSFIYSYINTEYLKDYDLWIADYRNPSGSDCPYDGDFKMWQYTVIGDIGKFNKDYFTKGGQTGVIGNCDLNLCYKDYDQLIYENSLNGFVYNPPTGGVSKEKLYKNKLDKIRDILDE